VEGAALAHLHRAEALLAKLRALGMVSWFFILDPGDYTAPARVVWAVYAASILYTLLTWLHVRSARAVRGGAVATTLLDGGVVAAICSVTGGIASDFYPYFYLITIANSIRFGAAPAFAMLAVNAALSALLFAWSPPLAAGVPPVRELGLRVFYLGFATILGSVLSGDARTNLALARDLLWRLIGVQEEERKRIAGEIHDRMGQRFFELHHGVDRLRGALADEKPEIAALLERLRADARAAGLEIRELMNELRPSVLDDFGASAAIREYGAALLEQGDLRVRVDVDPAARAARPEVNVALFRILQEAVLNVRKHADARELAIELRADPAAGRLMLVVRDDGRGFDPALTARGHFGLLTMRERAEACGGRLEIESAAGRGTRLRVEVPAGASP